jgi:AraC family transcriptional regulator of adaptative response / DNA-3-methyladenine glycosylase II
MIARRKLKLLPGPKTARRRSRRTLHEVLVSLSEDTCYRALTARDPRFDGVFFVGVRTTGIYCRPICRARTPGRDRCVFFTRAAEAERDGFRACFRCRPELAPGGGPVDAVPRLVQAAVQRIEAGALNEGSVDDLAAELGVTGRHLRRAMVAELGVSPVDLAQTRRLALAKQLLQDTGLSLTDIAFASGFASVRRFNALFQARFGEPPSALRRAHGGGRAAEAITLRLDHRPPLAWEPLLAHLAARAIPGVEVVEGGVYRRSVRLGGASGWIVVAPDPARPALVAEVSLSLAGSLMPLAARVRALFDLDARPAEIAAHLGRDRRLAPLVARRPGLRVPGAFDGFETTVRAILGQQVSVRGATTLSGRLVATFGEPIRSPHAGVTHLFPRPEVIAGADEGAIAAIGMPAARARAVQALARAVTSGLRMVRGGDAAETGAALTALPGIGPWTAEYVAMRALGWPDAFPASDLGLRNAMGGSSTKDLTAAAERWRPWRAYAAQHLWTSLTDGA